MWFFVLNNLKFKSRIGFQGVLFPSQEIESNNKPNSNHIISQDESFIDIERFYVIISKVFSKYSSQFQRKQFTITQASICCSLIIPRAFTLSVELSILVWHRNKQEDRQRKLIHISHANWASRGRQKCTSFREFQFQLS